LRYFIQRSFPLSKQLQPPKRVSQTTIAPPVRPKLPPKSKKRSSYARKEAARLHATRRAFERWGVTLTRADIDRIVALIQKGPQKDGGAELLVKQSCSRTLFNIPWKDGAGEGILLPCVFHTKCKMLCTVLPRNWRDNYDSFVLDGQGNSWLHGERSDLSDENLSDGD